MADSIFLNKSFQERIKLIVESRGDTFVDYIESSIGLNDLDKNKYLKLLQNTLSKGFSSVLKEYMPYLHNNLLNHENEINNDEFIPYYSYLKSDLEEFTDDYGINEIGATFKWFEKKENDFQKILDDIASYLKMPVKQIKVPTKFKTHLWLASEEMLVKLFEFLITDFRGSSYIDKSTKLEVFRDAFSGNYIEYQPRIKWLKIYQEIGFLYKTLIDNNLIEHSKYSNTFKNSIIFVNNKNSEFKTSIRSYVDKYSNLRTNVSHNVENLEKFFKNSIIDT